jgi:predicted GH43/DUF377 family glycosyl hydrolase
VSNGVGAAAFAGWDWRSVLDPTVIKEGTLFRMWYTGRAWDWSFRIGYASSPDGVNWTKHADNPILVPDAGWEAGSVRLNSVLKHGALYHMWYNNGSHDAIGHATSLDGINWTKDSVHNPVLGAGAPGSWDEGGAFLAFVLWDMGVYRMWYSGGASGLDTARLGMATSPDGFTWTKSGANPVLDTGGPSTWDATWVADPSVMAIGGAYKMWYSSVDKLPWSDATLRVGLATSPNGTNWTKHAGNPVLDVDPLGWDDRRVTAPWVIDDGGTYRMWYHGGLAGGGEHEMVGCATSADGVVWTKCTDNPVLRPTYLASLPVVLKD